MKWTLSLCAAAAMIAALVPRAIHAHHLNAGDVLAVLNRPEVKAQTGIQSTTEDARVRRLLIIRIGSRWFGYSDTDRRRMAALWLEMWRDAVPNGTLAVVDAVTGRPVVNFHPRGQVSVTQRPAGR